LHELPPAIAVFSAALSRWGKDSIPFVFFLGTPGNTFREAGQTRIPVVIELNFICISHAFSLSKGGLQEKNTDPKGHKYVDNPAELIIHLK